MSDEHDSNQSGLVPADDRGLTTRSSGLVQRGLDLLRDTLWKGYIEKGEQYCKQGRFSEAEELLLSALKEAKEFGPSDPKVFTTLYKLILLYLSQTQGNYAMAESAFEGKPTIVENPPTFTYTGNDKDKQLFLLVMRVNSLALQTFNEGKHSQSEWLFKKFMNIFEQVLGLDHLEVAGILMELSAVYRAQGKFAEAEPLMKRILAINEKVHGPNYYGVAHILEMYARLLREMDRKNEAAEMISRARAILDNFDREYPPL